MQSKDTYLDLTGRRITEVLTDSQIEHSTLFLLICCIKVAKRNDFTSKSVKIPINMFLIQLALKNDKNLREQIDSAIVGIINLYLIDKFSVKPIIQLVDCVTNFGNIAIKVTFNEHVFKELKHDLSVNYC